MTSRDDLVDLIASTAVDALDWHWAAAPGVPSPEGSFRHVAEAIYEALAFAERPAERCGICGGPHALHWDEPAS